MVKPAAGYRPLAYASPEAVQTTGTVVVEYLSRIGSGIVNTEFGRVLYKDRPR
jgi:hypothetical protein